MPSQYIVSNLIFLAYYLFDLFANDWLDML